jgi:hypothetical protein
MEAMNKAMPEGIVLFPGVPTGGERASE